ncbi:MAG: hypothetical protein IJY39_06215 [Clostridia bacterium]|nr:hypothetical protein [Clostridia bacterium]
MENNRFTYQYSAPKNKEVERIRSKYLPHEISKMDQLKKLDYKAQTAGQIQGLTVGIVGALVFGIGMCFGLDVFGGADWLTLLFCVPGAMLMTPAYFIHRSIARKTKARLTPEILRLSDEIMKS